MSSVLLGGVGGLRSGGSAQSQGAASPPAVPPGYGPSPADGGRRGNAVTVIAGVGVLLLAMGVGVLIGRSGASSKQPATPAAQVISVSQPAPATGAAATETTPANSEPAAKSGSPKSAKGGSAKESTASSGAGSAKGAGANESHPAPPSVVQNLAKKHGKSYEQESKNLPNVVSTGG